MDWMIVYLIATALILPALIYGLHAQNKTVRVFEKYSNEGTNANITGAELAISLLAKAGITNVDVVMINGKLTDCYDPRNKVVKLSKATYYSTSVGALGVVAHEVGHAIQDHKRMPLFRFRTFIIPIVNLISRAFVPMIFIGSILGFTLLIPTAGYVICWVSVALYGASLLLSFSTLGLEKDASKKALEMMKETGMFSTHEIESSSKVLDAAITTYIADFTTSLLYFLRFLSYAMIFNRD